MAWRLVVNVSHAILFGLLSYIVGGFPFLLNSISRTGHINQYQQVRRLGARSNGSRNPFSRNLIPSIFRRAIYDRIGCVGRGLACSASSSSLQSSLIRPPRGAPSRCSSFIACMQVSSSFLVHFFWPITVQQVLVWGSEHGLHAIRRSTERPVLSRQVVVTSASVQALVLRADS